MLHRAVLILVVATACASAVAQPADMELLAMEVLDSDVKSEETFDVRIRVRNRGVTDAHDVRMSFSTLGSRLVQRVVAPPEWNCAGGPYPAFDAYVDCSTSRMASGDIAEFLVSLAVRVPPSGRLEMFASVYSPTRDPDGSNQRRSLDVPVTSATSNVALSVHGTTTTGRVMPGEPVEVAFEVRNAGPDEAEDVLLILRPNVALTAAGEGWACGGLSTHVACRRSGLAAGSSATVVLRGVAPAADHFFLSVDALVRAEAVYDTGRFREQREVVLVRVGPAEPWTRILFPLTEPSMAGRGTRWETELAGLVLADEKIGFRPDPEEFGGIPEFRWPPYPLRTSFDLHEHLIPGWERGGQFLYVPTDQASKVRLNARVRNASRAGAGAELPLPREHEFTNGTVVLLNVPVGPAYRQTLRVYDDRGCNPTEVEIRLYADDETEPRTVIRDVLEGHCSHFTTAELLPVYPGYLQLDLSGHVTGNLASWRIEVQPLEPDVRLWAFASVTNRQTHEVTIVSPQVRATRVDDGWERLLVPLISDVRSGRGGALWRSELTVLVDADERIDYHPHPCTFITILCTPPPLYPLRQPFDGYLLILVSRFDTADGGQFLYVSEEDAPQFHLNGRVYDDRRIARGAELPIVGEAEFTSDPVVMLNVPSGPRLRHTLRVYDEHTRNGSLVEVRIFAPGEAEPRVRSIHHLFTEDQHVTTPLLLPTHPGFAQIELAPLLRGASLREGEAFRVDVQPLDPGAKIWAFVGVTDGDTHHVTIVSPQ